LKVFFSSPKKRRRTLLSSELAASSHRCNSKSVLRAALLVFGCGGFVFSPRPDVTGSHTQHAATKTSVGTKKDL